MKFVIVKFAGIDYWDLNFVDDPKKGVHISYSCHDTYSAKRVGIEAEYTNLRDAERDCLDLNHSNPSGYYGVCPVIE